MWTFAYANRSYDVLQLINLDRVKSTFWQDAYGTLPLPRMLRDIRVRYPIGPQPVADLFLASPDIRDGIPQPLPFTVQGTGSHRCVTFVLPSLAYWDMVAIRKVPNS